MEEEGREGEGIKQGRKEGLIEGSKRGRKEERKRRREDRILYSDNTITEIKHGLYHHLSSTIVTPVSSPQ